ncbi:MAG TPA: hypothetical protein PLU71_02340 [Candidatus Dependentiae bacterium]|nr:hypothetical protein [Candidatus Dependentiae bacterium]HRQ62670.1 hypothetical protein [Candidatus Dependentiae bacterium]
MRYVLLLVNLCLSLCCIGMEKNNPTDNKVMVWFNIRTRQFEAQKVNVDKYKLERARYRRLFKMVALLREWKSHNKECETCWNRILNQHKKDVSILTGLAAGKNTSAQDAYTRIQFNHPLSVTKEQLNISIDY